jgi:hypothetical protein
MPEKFDGVESSWSKFDGVESSWSKHDQEAADSARKLLRYCQLPDKIYRYISRDIWNFFAVSQNFLSVYNLQFQPAVSNSRLENDLRQGG